MTLTLPAQPTTYPVAELERRFSAFAIDRLLGWGLLAGAGGATWALSDEDLRTTAGVVAGTAVLLWLVLAVVLGTTGSSPGKSLTGLRVVHHGTGTPIGVGRALLRSLVLALSGLPTFGIGVATLAWTAVEDPGRQRRGWHDHVGHSVVVDVRPAPEVDDEEVDEGPRHIVNLTAMRLIPAPPVEAPRTPARTHDQSVRRQPLPPDLAPPRPVPTPQHVPPPPHAAPQHAAPQHAAPQHVPQPGPSRPGRHAQPPAANGRSAPQPAYQPQSPRQQPPMAPPTTPPPMAPPQRGTPPSYASHPGGSGQPPQHPARQPRWRVHFDNGESFVVAGLALVGRRPEPRAGEVVAHLVPLASQDMSVSKTHAQFGPAPDGTIVVMDRGSTNGTILVRRGVSRDLTPGRPATLLDGDKVVFGDREMVLTREA